MDFKKGEGAAEGGEQGVFQGCFRGVSGESRDFLIFIFSARDDLVLKGRAIS